MARPLASDTLDVACVIPSLRAGGSERVLANLASELAAHGNRVAVLTLMPPGEVPFYPLADAVDHIALGGLGTGATSLGNPATLLRAALRVRKALSARRPGVVLGFATVGSMLAVLATRGLGLPVIAAERVDPKGHGQRIGRVRSALRDKLLARADHVVVQTARARRALTWLPDARLSVIPNRVHAVTGQARPDQPGPDGRFRMTGAGRFNPQKGFDLLIAAFGRLAARFSLWDLVIHGEGPQRAELEGAISRLGLGGRVRLPGVTDALERDLLAAHIMAFPSRFEGFPNVLAEGMAAGLPAVGFPDVSGVEDLLRDGETGLLADWMAPVDSLADRLATLMNDPALRARLGANARQHVAAFTPQIHYEQWETLLRRLARSGS